MNTESVTIPAGVRTAFRYYALAAGVSLTNAVFQLTVHLNGVQVLVGSIIEAALLVGLGSHMRAGKQWARQALLGIAGAFIGLGVLALIALGAALGQQGGLVKLALMFVAAKIALTGLAVWHMYRPVNQAFFR